MNVSNPRRILLLGSPDAGHIGLLEELTGTAPTPTTTSLAGLSHDLSLKTNYYSATIPIWLDEVSLQTPETWSSDFLAPEAKEVLAALGAFILIFQKPVTQQDYVDIKGLVKEVGKVVKEGCGWNWEGVVLAVGLKQDVVPNLAVDAEEWEDFCREEGFEWVDGEGIGKNEFNEAQGVARIKEALESNDWEDAGDGELEIDEDETGFKAEAIELQMEMFGMKQAIYGGDDDEQAEGSSSRNDEDEQEDVEQLEAMMRKLQAVKDMSSGLPEAERKKFAAKAVNNLMKTL